GIERIGGFCGETDQLARNQVFYSDSAHYKGFLQRVQQAIVEDFKTAVIFWLSDGGYIFELYPFPAFKAAATGADPSKGPVPGTPLDLRLLKLQCAAFSNGLKVILAERHEVPVVQFWMAVDAGYAADQFAAPGTASMTSSLLDGGTSSRNALEISDKLALLVAQL